MKFILNKIQTSGARLGLLSSSDPLSSLQLETPSLSLYMKSSTVPHLTHEVLQKVTENVELLQLSVGGLETIQDRIKNCPLKMNEFIGMKEYFTFLTVQDAVQGSSQTRLHEGERISVWTKFGRKQHSYQTYMDCVQSLKPDMYQILCDNDTNTNSSKKRVNKSYLNSLTLLDKCMNLHEKSSVLKGTHIIVSLIGGYDSFIREQFSSDAAKYQNVFGYNIDGLYNHETSSFDDINGDLLRDMVKASLKHLPADKLRIVNGPWSPLTVLHLVQQGCDLFDTSYPYLMTEKGSALVFPVTFDLSSGESYKKIKLEKKFEISLKDEMYKDKFEPILPSCDCLTCQCHTKAYIHHLLVVNELLAPVLLMIHNLHHYLEFFKSIRLAASNDSIDRYIDVLSGK